MLDRLLKFLPVETLRGYENPELIETIFQKTLAYRPTDPWPEMVGVRSVVDFGGACGRHYKEAQLQSPSIRWAVVETPSMAARARELETPNLRFFTDVDTAAEWIGEVEVVHSNGAIQYAGDPLKIVTKLCSLSARKMLWYRVFLGSGQKATEVSRLADNGPGRMKLPWKKVSYDRSAIREEKFLAAHEGYRLSARGSDWFKFDLDR